jgi:hypothetical protein
MEEYSHNMNFVGVVGSRHNFCNCLSSKSICCCGSGLVASNVISDQVINYMSFYSVSSRAKSDIRRFEVFNCPSFFGGLACHSKSAEQRLSIIYFLPVWKQNKLKHLLLD